MARYAKTDREETLSFIRRQFITAAINEFASQGYSEANINRISQAAGYAKGTIYNHFANKEALMLQIIELLAGDHYAFMAEQVRQQTHPKARLERFFEAGFQFVESFPMEALFLVRTLYSPNTEFREPLGKAYLPMFHLVAEEILEPGIAAGAFRKVNPMEHASLIMTLYLGTCSQVDENCKPLFDPHQVAEFAYHALCMENIDR